METVEKKVEMFLNFLSLKMVFLIKTDFHISLYRDFFYYE